MNTAWYTNPTMLAAGNARGLPGGDPDAPPTTPARTARGAGRRAAPAGMPLTPEQAAALVRASRARLLHPNRKFSPRRAGTR